ncbi:MAG: alanine racemase, partial [Bacteroidales bacterium]|nr:alanine racemase [Bacteroidales bacterium]
VLLQKKKINTPRLIISEKLIEHNYNYFNNSIFSESARIFYSLKANNHPSVIRKLKSLGSGFEISSDGELEIMKKEKIKPELLIYSNPVKIPTHIANAYKYGIKKFAFDSENELKKIKKYAPKSGIFARINVANDGSEWKLTGKFGVTAGESVNLLKKARLYELNPIGITFHVGWNNKSHTAWENALNTCCEILSELKKNNINLRFVNIGGGFPAHNVNQYTKLNQIAKIINPLLQKIKNNFNVEIYTEPGSFIVANSGVLLVKIFDIIERNSKSWIYVDSGISQGFYWIFSGLQYNVIYPYKISKNKKLKKYVITGPTCDTHDIFTKDAFLPEDLCMDDYLIIYPAGAYISSAREYNGFGYPEIKIFR